MELVIVAAIVVGGVGFGGLLLFMFGRSRFEAGKLEERTNEQREAAEATKRADDVLAEHRAPDDGHVTERLRRGDF